MPTNVTDIFGLASDAVATEVAKAFLTPDSTVNDSLSFVQFNIFPLDSLSLEINLGGFTCSTAGIAVPSNALYLVSGNMMYFSGVARSNPEFAFTINNTVQPEVAGSSYMRAADGHNEASSSLTTVYSLNANDVIGLQFRRAAQGGTVDLISGSHVIVQKIADL